MVSVFNNENKHVQYGSDEQQDERVEVNAGEDGPRVVVRKVGENRVNVVSVKKGEKGDPGAVQIDELGKKLDYGKFRSFFF